MSDMFIFYKFINKSFKTPVQHWGRKVLIGRASSINVDHCVMLHSLVCDRGLRVRA